MKPHRIFWSWWLGAAALVVAVSALFGAGFLFSGPRQLSDWSRIRAVVIESDDWGLPGFSPSLAAWADIERQELAPGAFPPVYWGSTLEDSLMVSELCAIMAQSIGHDGLPAVFQPNYVMGSLAWLDGLGQGSWQEFSFPDFPPEYQRPGLLESVLGGIQAGLWYPELHARWHYDPQLRRVQALSTPLARQATIRGIMLFPQSEKARELGSWRDPAELASELEESQTIFAATFGRLPGSIIAPDYTWNAIVEDVWAAGGVKVIQAKREQRNPDLGSGPIGRLKKYLLRQYEIRRYPDRKYLERNCRLEPVQAPDPGAVVAACVNATRQAWRQGFPAIVESHRVNFAHLDPEVVQQGQKSLADYCQTITANPGELPVFLTDWEVAQIQARGCSWVQRGEMLVLRNGTHSSKMVAIPGEIWAEFSEESGSARQTTLVSIPALSTRIFEREAKTRSFPFGR